MPTKSVPGLRFNRVTPEVDNSRGDFAVGVTLVVAALFLLFSGV